jgi:hypothetical protein
MVKEAKSKVEGEDGMGMVTAGCLRRMLYDLEAGRIVRVALDLQALIQELEGSGGGNATVSGREPQSDGGLGR